MSEEYPDDEGASINIPDNDNFGYTPDNFLEHMKKQKEYEEKLFSKPPEPPLNIEEEMKKINENFAKYAEQEPKKKEEEKKEEPKKDIPPPKKEEIGLTDIFDGENLICRYMKFMATQYDGYPHWNLAGALQLMAIISDKKLRFELKQQDIYTNLNIFCVGNSTISRKSTAKEKADHMAMPLLLMNRRMASSFSPERFIEDLSDCNHAFLWKDEAAGLIASMQKSYMADMRDFFMEIYGNQYYKRALRTGKADKKTEFEIADPYLNLWFMTTPDNLKEYVSKLDITSGWLVRFLWLAPTGKKAWMGFEERTEEDKRRFGELLGAFQLRMNELKNSPPILMKWTPEAKACYHKWQEMNDGIMLKEDDAIKSSIFGRLETYAIKLAMLFTISNPKLEMTASTVPGKKENIIYIQKKEMHGACVLIDELFYPAAKQTIIGLGESDDMKKIEKVKKAVRDMGCITQSDLIRKVHLTSKEVKMAIEHLTDSGEVFVSRSGDATIIEINKMISN